MKDHVKTDLVVTGARAAMRYRYSARFAGVFRDGNGLNQAFGADAEGISVILEDVPENQVPDDPVIVMLDGVNGRMRLYTQAIGVFLYLF
jgi:hypothetical protein